MKDIYVKFKSPGLDGESTDHEHGKWLEVSTWNHRIKQPKSATASSTGGHTAERCEHEVMEFTKNIDIASPKLYQNCSGGQTFDEVEIEFMRADGNGDRINYMKIQLKNVIISDVAPSVGEDGFPTETFALSYGAIDWKYTQQDGKGGSAGSSSGSWSLVNNKASYSI